MQANFVASKKGYDFSSRTLLCILHLVNYKVNSLLGSQRMRLLLELLVKKANFLDVVGDKLLYCFIILIFID